MCLLYGVLPILSTDKKTEIIKIDRLYDGGVLLAWGGSTSIGNPITSTDLGGSKDCKKIKWKQTLSYLEFILFNYIHLTWRIRIWYRQCSEVPAIGR